MKKQARRYVSSYFCVLLSFRLIAWHLISCVFLFSRASRYTRLMQIALLTDFGTRDSYVAAMKGVIAARTRATIHDLSHEIPPHDVFAAAWFLRNIERYWPKETIFVCVVDPGVGTRREIIALKKDGRFFLAPDNGLLTFVDPHEHRDGPFELSAVTNEALFLADGSNTFHGRDRFAPAAAAIAEGASLDELGPRLDSIVHLPYEPPHYSSELVRGTIVSIDRFGNAVTDVEHRKLPFARFVLNVADAAVSSFVGSYEEGGTDPFLIVGSSGCIEVSIRQGSAADRLHLRVLDHVELRAEPV
jgi:S-adenosyl-L-methionine hydrolase (adenosine-forming)